MTHARTDEQVTYEYIREMRDCQHEALAAVAERKGSIFAVAALGFMAAAIAAVLRMDERLRLIEVSRSETAITHQFPRANAK